MSKNMVLQGTKTLPWYYYSKLFRKKHVFKVLFFLFSIVIYHSSWQNSFVISRFFKENHGIILVNAQTKCVRNTIGRETGTEKERGRACVCVCVFVLHVCSGPEEKLSKEDSPEPIEYWCSTHSCNTQLLSLPLSLYSTFKSLIIYWYHAV